MNKSPLRIALTVTGGLVALCCLGGTIGAILDSTDKPKPAVVTTSAPAPTGVQPAVQESPEPQVTYGTPNKKSFTLAVKTTRKKCFGSAGCNVNYHVELTYNDALPLDPSKTYQITYEVRGLEDTAINTVEVTGTDYRYDSDEFGQTPRSSSKLTVVVTSVEEQ